MTDPVRIWEQYEDGRNYKAAIDLYDNVETYEAFYVSDQWRGLNAPDLPKVTLNFTQRVVSMHVAKVVSDDIAANFSPFKKTPETESECRMLSGEIDRVFELTDLKRLHKTNVRDAAVDGDACNYFWFDADAETGHEVKGEIRVEQIENINVIFGNPHTPIVNDQPYIIIALRKPYKEVQEEAIANGLDESDATCIIADSDEHQEEKGDDDKLCTVLVKLFKREGHIWAVKTTRTQTVREAWDLGLTVYPIAWMSWEKVRHSYHGRSAMAGMLPNQIALNKAYSGIIKQVMTSGFPTLFYNKQFLDRWDGRPGRAVAVNGNFEPSKAATYLTPPGVDPSITNVMNNLVDLTRDFMGTSDATLGNVNPSNATAIIALQQSDQMPMELHRQEFYSFVEQEVRIIVDMMRACYGTRDVCISMDGDDIDAQFDFGSLEHENLKIKVDIGAASYWSETLQVETLNNIFTSGIMEDPETFALFLEVFPEKYIPHKEKLVEFNEQRRQQAEQMPPKTPPETPPEQGGMPNNIEPGAQNAPQEYSAAEPVLPE